RIDAQGGVVFATGGDAFAAAFEDAPSAVRSALDCQGALEDEPWPVTRPLRARMGLHTGTGQMRDNNSFGPPLNRWARLMSAARGGQVVWSDATRALARDALGDLAEFVDLGEHRLRDLARPMHVFQVTQAGLSRDFPPLRSLDMFATNLPAQLTAFVGR